MASMRIASASASVSTSPEAFELGEKGQDAKNGFPPIPLPRTTLDPSERTLIMGVINTTPDSFSDGGVHYAADTAIEAAVAMFQAGADIVDIGGESTRPGSLPADPEEEMRRAIPVVEEVHRRYPEGVISIDTRRRITAEAAVAAGAQIINDVTGFRDDPGMIHFAREAGTGCIIMHMLGEPRTMQQNITYDAFPDDILTFLKNRIEALESHGIRPDRIVIDPGVGFGKTFDQNLIIINRIGIFNSLGKHVLLGASRKAFLGKILDEPDASRRDIATAAVTTAAVLKGVSIVRAHDVPITVQVCKVAEAVKREQVPA